MNENPRDAVEQWYAVASEKLSEENILTALRKFYAGEVALLEALDATRAELERELEKILVRWDIVQKFRWRMRDAVLSNDQADSAVGFLQEPSGVSLSNVLGALDAENSAEFEFCLTSLVRMEAALDREIDLEQNVIVQSAICLIYDVRRKLDDIELWK